MIIERYKFRTGRNRALDGHMHPTLEGDWVRYDDHVEVINEIKPKWIPIEEVELELGGVYWLKAHIEVLENPAGWTGETFIGGGWPLHKSVVSHVMRLTRPEA